MLGTRKLQSLMQFKPALMGQSAVIGYLISCETATIWLLANAPLRRPPIATIASAGTLID
jgi:hypothetical protein